MASAFSFFGMLFLLTIQLYNTNYATVQQLYEQTVNKNYFRVLRIKTKSAPTEADAQKRIV